MRRTKMMLQAAVSATLLSLPAMSMGRQVSSFTGAMDPIWANGPTALNDWTDATQWSSGVPNSAGATAFLGNSTGGVWASSGPPNYLQVNGGLPYGGNIGLQIPHGTTITLGTLTIANDIYGANIFGGVANGQGGGTISFPNAGVINVNGALNWYGYLSGGGYVGNDLWNNFSAPNGLTINGGPTTIPTPGYVWLGGNNSAVNGLTISNTTVWMLDEPDNAYDPWSQMDTPPGGTTFNNNPVTGSNPDNFLAKAGSTVTLNAGGIFYFSDQAVPPTYTSTLNYKMGPGGGTFSTGYPMIPEYTGNFSGTGTLTFSGNVTIASGTASQFAGPMHFYGDADDYIETGTSFPSVPNVYIDSTMILDASEQAGTPSAIFTTNTQLNYNGGKIVMLGSNNAGTTSFYHEHVGTINLNGGINSLTMLPQASSGNGSIELTATALVRNNGANFYSDSAGMGGYDVYQTSGTFGIAGNSGSYVQLTNVPTMTGGGASSNFVTNTFNTKVSVIPWAYGNSDIIQAGAQGPGTGYGGNDTDNGAGFSTFLTYGSGTIGTIGSGLRPLYVDYVNGATDGVGADEFVHSLTGTGSGTLGVTPTSLDNVYLTVADDDSSTSITLTGTVHCNSLTTSNAEYSGGLGGISISGGTIDIQSGGLLLSTAGGVISSTINFGSAPGVIITPDASASTTISGTIIGTSSLSTGGGGNVTLSGNNTYTGATYLEAGYTYITSNVLSNSAGPFGKSTLPIYFGTGTDAPNFYANQWSEAILTNGGSGSVTIGRPLIVGNTSGDSIAVGIEADQGTFVINGTVSVPVGTMLTNMGGTVVYNGVISGAGGLQESDGGFYPSVTYLNTANSYSGGTTIGKWGTEFYGNGPFDPVYFVGNNSAFGTGLISTWGGTATGKVDINATTAVTISNAMALSSDLDIDEPSDGTSGASIVFSGPVTFSGERALWMNNNNVSFSNLHGFGFIQLLNNTDFTGGTTASAGTITVSGNNLQGVANPGNSNLTGDVQVGSVTSDPVTSVVGVFPGGALVVNPATDAGSLTTNALGSASLFLVANGSALQLKAFDSNGSVTLPNAMYVSGTGLGGGSIGNGEIENVRGNNTLTGPIALTAFDTGDFEDGGVSEGTSGNVTIGVDASSSLTITNSFTHSYNDTTALSPQVITKTGAGVLIVGRLSDTQYGPVNSDGTAISLSSPQAALGGVIVNAGTLVIGGDGGPASAFYGVNPLYGNDGGPLNNTGTLGTSWVSVSTAVPNGLQINPGATFDIGSAGMVIDYSASGNSPIGEGNPVGHTQLYPAGSIQAYLQAAADPDGGGVPQWDKHGLTSFLANADYNYTQATGVGALDDFDYANILGSGDWMGQTWLGIPITTQSVVLVRYTYYGDTNLDGVVDAVDFGDMIAGFEGTGLGWLYGDFNYDGNIDGTDFSLFVSGLLGQGSGQPVNPAFLGAHPMTMAEMKWLLTMEKGLSPVKLAEFEHLMAAPEPTSVALVGAAAIGLLSGRRRRRSA